MLLFEKRHVDCCTRQCAYCSSCSEIFVWRSSCSIQQVCLIERERKIEIWLKIYIFCSGTVMGMSVVGCGLAGVSALFLILQVNFKSFTYLYLKNNFIILVFFFKKKTRQLILSVMTKMLTLLNWLKMTLIILLW